MARYFIIGDIHGTLEELRELWEAMSPTKDDVVIPVGDLIDKGPDSVGVVRFLYGKVVEGYTVTPVEGNHDNKLRRYRRHVRLFEEQEKPIPMNPSEDMHRTHAGLTREEGEWMDTFPFYVLIPEHNALVVHGGVMPNVDFLPPMEDIRSYSNRKRQKYETLLRTRHVTPEGEFVKLGRRTDRDPFWAEVYDGRLGHVYFGHQPFRQETPKEYPHATGIDLAACFGGWLAAVVLDGDRRDVIVAKAHDTYSDSYWE